MEVTIYNLLNISCFKFIDLSCLIALTVSGLIANLTEHHGFPGMVLSTLHSSYHSIITILQSGYCYYPHFVEEELLPLIQLACGRAIIQNQLCGPSFHPQLLLHATLLLFRYLCGNTCADFSRLRNEQYLFRVEAAPLCHHEEILGEVP